MATPSTWHLLHSAVIWEEPGDLTPPGTAPSDEVVSILVLPTESASALQTRWSIQVTKRNVVHSYPSSASSCYHRFGGRRQMFKNKFLT